MALPAVSAVAHLYVFNQPPQDGGGARRTSGAFRSTLEERLRWMDLDEFTGLNPSWIHTVKDHCSPPANRTRRRLNDWLRDPIALFGLAPRQVTHSVVPNLRT